uniref:HD domain-containing protein n=1 Tax=Cucumis melo TaxID=3656 RepID=A0A9I9DLE2_CUCME
MAVNSPTHLAPPPLPSLSRSSFAFVSRIFLRPASPSAFPWRTLVSLRAQPPNTDGYASKQPLGLENSEPSFRSTGSPSSSSVIDFLTLCHRLKTTKRKGWINHGINGPESIADHMYRMALMSLIAGDLPGVNRERCIKIALVHDIAEAEEIKELWAEYENNSSLEANLVKDFDKVLLKIQSQVHLSMSFGI